VRAEIVERLRGAMRERGLDALVACSPENVAYLAGLVVPSQPLMRWRHAFCIVPLDGPTAMVVVDMEEHTVRSRVPGPRYYVWREFAGDCTAVVAEALRDLGLADARLGLELDYLPARDHAALRERLPAARLEAAEGLFARQREIKTAGELDLLRRLSRLTDAALHDALAAAGPGSSELELAGALTGGIYRGGAESFKLLIVASGERSQFPNVGPTERRLRVGDLIRLEIFGVLEGYLAGVCRTGIVGAPTAEQERIWRNLVESKHLLLDTLRPGASSDAIYAAYTRKFAELGVGRPISFVGHGIGLHLHEEPYLGGGPDRRLEAGMVLGVEPLLYLPGAFGLQLKDMVAITADGCELLSDYTATDTLFPVGHVARAGQ
jgi:Xaa-Pro aminopeptidase